ncbi:MAG: MoxR family ATPase [Dehalococcoidia bacterium]|nr:MoxR family ATPase [Dehalococcoidia bacterium]
MEDPRIVAERIIANVEKVIVGKSREIRLAVTALICGGHMLIEDVPGVGKTMLARAIAVSTGCTFRRIQFTPDLLPSDVTGVSIYNQKTGDFEFRPGPILAQVVLADEVNRATPKTQSALLEAMEERQVTVDGVTYRMPQPFMVLATQNPIEYEGTFPLPEAQLDRFMFAIYVGYPSEADEKEIVRRTTGVWEPHVPTFLSADQIVALQRLARQMPVPDNVIRYAVELVRRTRPQENSDPFIRENVTWGVGPRAAQFLILAGKAQALLSGKYAPDVEDIQAVALPVLRHRMVLSYQAEAEGIRPEQIIRHLMEKQVSVV